MRKFNVLLAFIAVLALVVPASADVVVWDQRDASIDYGPDGAFLGTVYLEENNNGCDDFLFTTADTVEITKVTFWVANYTGNVAPDAPPIRASIVFFSNDGGYPGMSGYYGTTNGSDYNVRPVGYDDSDPTASIPSGGWYATNNGDPAAYQGGTGNTGWLYKAVLETSGKGLTATDTGTLDYRGYKIWEVAATLPVAFAADPNVHYWVGFDCSDQVATGEAADGFEILCLAVGNVTLDSAYVGGVGPLWGGGYDFQFVMEGVPEPATMALLAIGGVGLLIRRKR